MTPQSLQMFNYAQTLPVFTFAIVYWQICFIAKLFCFFRNEGKKIVFVLKRGWTSKMSQMNDSGCRGFSWWWMNLQQIFHHDYCYVATLFDFSPLQNRCALPYTISPLLATTSLTKTLAAEIQVIFLWHFGSHRHRFHHTLKLFASVRKKWLQIKQKQWVCILFLLQFIELKWMCSLIHFGCVFVHFFENRRQSG